MSTLRMFCGVLVGTLGLAACSSDSEPGGGSPDVDSGGLDASFDGAALDATRDSTSAIDSSSDGSKTDARSDASDAADAADAKAALAFPIADPPAGFTGLPSSAPITISGETGKTISHVSITNPSGPCIVVHGGADVVIDHVAIGPCKGDGIQIDGHAARVTVRDSYVHDTGGVGVSTYQVSGITVTGSWFARNSSGGYFLESDTILFEKNSILNVQGPMPRGQMAQLDKSNGGNTIRCNIMENRPGESTPEDGINLYQSAGTSAAPILVEGNRIKGGGPSTSGGGILLGDGGAASAYQISRFNILADPGQYGTAVAGGSHMTIQGNLVYAKKQAFTNTGIYVWDQYKSSCTGITVKDNQVNWTNKDGANNPWWDGGNCSALVESSNDWKATFDATIVDKVPDVCK